MNAAGQHDPLLIIDCAAAMRTGKMQMNMVCLEARGGRWGLAAGCSASALIMASASPAQAQCMPHPTQANSATICSIENNRARVLPLDSAVKVLDLAAASEPLGPAVTMEVPTERKRFYADGLYVSDGRTVDGDLIFGDGFDTFIATNNVTGVTGRIDGGGREDYFIHELSNSASIDLNPRDVINFEVQGVRSLGKNTTVTVNAVNPVRTRVVLSGDGNILNAAIIDGVVTTYPRPLDGDMNASVLLAGFTNEGSIRQGYYGPTGSFTNTGTIDSGRSFQAVAISGTPDLTFVNTGKISNTSSLAAVDLSTYPGTITALNSGMITGGLEAEVDSFTSRETPLAHPAISLNNSGTILTNSLFGEQTVAVLLKWRHPSVEGTLLLSNSGTIEAAEVGGTGAFLSSSYGGGAIGKGPTSITINNSGTIRSNGGGDEIVYNDRGFVERYTQMATALGASATSGTLNITNSAGALIEASSNRSVALITFDIGLDLTNAGTIRGSAGTTFADDSSLVSYIRSTFLAGAVQAVGDANDHIVNFGTIIGSIGLGGGNDTIANRGTIRGDVFLGPGDDTFIEQAGTTLIGTVDGGAGTDGIVIDAARDGTINSGHFTNFEHLTQVGTGNVAYSGQFAFNAIDVLDDGQLIGLAGSVISADGITVGSKATFGSAGVINGNVTVNGTLSLGASLGTMTVNGSVALASGSTSLIEITPGLSDRLVIDGVLTIAQGATLQLAATGAVKPGTIIDLIVASGGIAGTYTNIVKPASLFGFLVQDNARIRLAGEFLNDTNFSAPVQRTIGYVNTTLVSGRSNAALLAAAPSLVMGSGMSNAALFGRLTPEAYASAQQITVGNGLTLAESGRGADFAARRDSPGLFTFASVLGGKATLEADAASGTSLAYTSNYGFLGGIGFAGATWSIGTFGGYLNNRQTLASLSARTRADGAVAGVHGRFASGGFGVKATVAYDGGNANTCRTVLNGSVYARYHRHGLTADASIDYALPVTGTWTVRPRLGATAIRVTRSAASEVGTSAFALSVARRAETAVFVDGGMTFTGSVLVPGARIMPYLSVGVRYQLQGRTPIALAGFGGGDTTLLAEGASRAPALAMATLGAEIALSPRLAVFGAIAGESGDADYRASGRTGLRLSF